MIVGRTIGLDALAAVGCTGSIAFLVIGFAQGLTSGFAVVTAQKFGAGDYDGVKQSVATSVILCFIINIFATGVSVLLAKPLLELMRTPTHLIDGAYDYIVVIFAGTGAAILFNMLSNIIRAVGDSKTPLYFLIIASVINIALDYLFILYFHMGVAGAAWATIIAQILPSIMCLVYIRRRLPVLKAGKLFWRFNKSSLWEHLRIGFPMGFQLSIIAIGAIILQAALNDLGGLAVGAFTVAQRIDILAVQPLMSFGITMATYTAQNYGARNIARIHKGVIQCAVLAIGFSLICGLVIMLGADKFITFFVGNDPKDLADLPKTIELAKTYLKINCSMYFLLAILFIVRNALQGLGNSIIPTIAGVMELIMRTAAAVILAGYIGFTGISLANPIAWAGAVLPMVIAYILIIRKLFREHPVKPRLD